MTTKFETKEEALKMAILYAGSEETVEELTHLGSGSISQWGTIIPVDLFEMNGKKGKCRVGVEIFRDGYALWLITDAISRRV